MRHVIASLQTRLQIGAIVDYRRQQCTALPSFASGLHDRLTAVALLGSDTVSWRTRVVNDKPLFTLCMHRLARATVLSRYVLTAMARRCIDTRTLRAVHPRQGSRCHL